MHIHTNELVHETSPYLLQHAHNPVQWFPWGEKALNKAKEENKPILVSIGYSACHWCHVMERESFENEEVAQVMNNHFINIKVDREERPDIDHIYMDAVQAMTGSGGWPLNVFLTPEGKPFYGGTYFPPKSMYNRPSWLETLNSIQLAYNKRRDEIETQANHLVEHLQQSNNFGIQQSASEELFTPSAMEEMLQNIMKQADREWGGFGKAPKFPQTFTITFLLRYHFCYERTLEQKDEANNHMALVQAMLSLDRMLAGGIYDQLGGGFARYSTDAEWLAPHFEKMLYDNALLVSTLSEAYQLTRADRYRVGIEETIAFVERELMHPQNGFYAALDADSEGEEGKFYVWDYAEIQEALGSDAGIFCEYYDVSPGGNWEGKNILRISSGVSTLSSRFNLAPPEIEKIISNCRKKLFEARSQRIHPALDDKIILGWNALMNTAICNAFAATGEEKFRQLATRNMKFLLEHLVDKGSNEFRHTWKNGEARYPAFVDDYAFLIQALIKLQEISGNLSFLEKAVELTELVIESFSDEESGFFFYTKKGQEDIIVRKKEMYDGAIPSGNAVMAYNLYHLGILKENSNWKERSYKMMRGLGKVAVKYPTSFGVWACLLLENTNGTAEIVIKGSEVEPVQKELLSNYIPHRVLMTSKGDENWPLLKGKPLADKTNIWLCQNYACQPAVPTVKDLMTLINSRKMVN